MLRARSKECAAQAALSVPLKQCYAGGMDEVTKAINHFSVLMEDQNGKLDAVLEAVGDMQQKVAKLDGIERDVAELKQDVRVIKAAVVDVSRDLAEHKSLPAHVAHGRA